MLLRRAATTLALGVVLLSALPAAALEASGRSAVRSEPTAPRAEPSAAQQGKAAAWPIPSGTVTSPDGRTHFIDRYGRVLRLRGLNLGKTDTVTEERVARLAGAGFGLMRLNIQWEKVEPRRGHYDTGYLRYLDRVLGWADRHRVLVLIDWHQDVFGPAFGHNGIPAWATRTDGLPFEPNPDDWFADYFQPAVQAAFTHLYDDGDLRAAQTAVYAEVAAQLRGHRSLLGYDLFNEPFGPIPGDPADPDDQIEASAALERGAAGGHVPAADRRRPLRRPRRMALPRTHRPGRPGRPHQPARLRRPAARRGPPGLRPALLRHRRRIGRRLEPLRPLHRDLRSRHRRLPRGPPPAGAGR